MNAPDAARKAAFWDAKITAWEKARYSALSLLNPFAWTVRSRMGAASRLLRGEFRRHARVLDLGCGSGLLARAVLDAPDRSYTGVDFSAAAVEMARTRFAAHADRVRFERLDVLQAPAWEAQLIVFLGLLDWLEEGEMAELFGKLKADVLCFSFTESESGLAGLAYGQYRRCADGEYRARNFTEARIRQAAAAGGYRVDRVLRVSRLDPGRLATACRS
jgi:predicted TPR repeat methyltransferase